MTVHKMIDERDVNFVLFDQLKLEEMTKIPRYSEFDKDTFRMIVNEAFKFADGVLAPLNPIADRVGCRFEKGKVTTPKEYKSAYRLLAEGGWIALAHDPKFGGQGMPNAVAMFATELFYSACCGFGVFPGIARGAGHLIENFGTDELKNRYLTNMYTGKWGGTMCLTEPQAGSDVGAAKTTAKKVGDYYLIQGTKQFITCGEHDVNENIIHLVLARTEAAPSGVKGLSLFCVPKIRVNDDGSLSDPNDVVCSGIEHKMGMHGSPTCVLNFGDNNNCHGWLVGEECRGINCMFQLMNEARLRVGAQAGGVAGAAYLTALNYARQRIQGHPLKSDKHTGAVAIIEHPDVRRMLLTMKAYAEAIRAITYKGAMYEDLSHNHPDEATRNRCADLLEIITPVAKSYCSDKAFDVTRLAVQVLGGYGYCSEYPIEQYLRDCKISSIYEGTNGIQAMDLLGRKVRMRNGAAWRVVMEELGAFIETHKSHPEFGALITHLNNAKTRAEQTIKVLMDRQKDIEWYFLQATPFLEMLGHVLAARELIEQAIVAADKKKRSGAAGSEAAFLDGKSSTAKFFVHNILPQADSIAESIIRDDHSAVTMSVESF